MDKKGAGCTPVIADFLRTELKQDSSDFAEVSSGDVHGGGGIFMYKHEVTSFGGLDYSQVMSSSGERNAQTTVMVSREALLSRIGSKWAVKQNKPVWSQSKAGPKTK